MGKQQRITVGIV